MNRVDRLMELWRAAMPSTIRSDGGSVTERITWSLVYALDSEFSILQEQISELQNNHKAKETISRLKQALYEIKDAPLSRDEMIEKAETTLRKMEE